MSESSSAGLSDDSGMAPKEALVPSVPDPCMPDPTEICDRSDMLVRSCAHCRDTGRYVPLNKTDAAGQIFLSLDGIGNGELSIDAVGMIWLSPGRYDGDGNGTRGNGGVKFVDADEGIRRGKFGRGKNRF